MTYAGVTFRSTLEADWAATLDRGQIAWSYEPEAVQLPSGTYYRPDFWLPDLEAWLEVKGPGVPGAEKYLELATIEWVIVGLAPVRGRANWDLYAPKSAKQFDVKGLGIIMRMAMSVGVPPGDEWMAKARPSSMSRAPR